MGLNDFRSEFSRLESSLSESPEPFSVSFINKDAQSPNLKTGGKEAFVEVLGL